MFQNSIKIALRNLLRSPGFTILNLTGFALGMACAFIGIQYAWQEISYDRGYANSERIYRVGTDFMGMGGFANAPEALVAYMRLNAPEIEAATRVRGWSSATLERDDRRLSVKALQTDSSFFKIFDYEFLEGNADHVLKSPHQAVLTESLAHSWFGQGSALGKTINIGEDKTEYIVAGVVKDEKRMTHLSADLWVPIYSELSGDGNWYSTRFHNYFLLKEGAAQADLNKSLQDLVRKNVYPNFSGSGLSFEEWQASEHAYRLIIHPLQDIHLKSKLRFEMGSGGDEAKVWGFLVIGLFVLIIAIVNYVNLSTAKSSQRAKEVGVKKTIGAGRGRLISQFLTEAMVFGILAALAALGFTELLQTVFQKITGETLLANSLLRPTVIGGFIIFCLFVSLFAGIYPAFFLTAFRPVQVLKGDVAQGKDKWMRNGLVVLQFTIAGALIIGSLVVWQQLDFMANKDLGFNRNGVLTIKSANELGEHAKSFQSELEQLPIVINSSFSQSIPAGNTIVQTTFQSPEMEQSIPLRTFPSDAEFLETLGMRLVDGKGFPHKNTPDTTVALITESAAKALGLNDPIGAEINEGMRVLGVVSDFHIESLRNGIEPIVFTHALTGNYLNVSLSPNSGKDGISDFIRNAEKTWEKFMPGTKMRYSFLDESFARLAHQDEVQGKGILALTVLSIFIACLGLFGLAAYTAERRTKEIGIRKVLGASVSGIVALLSKDFLKLVVIALIIAIPLSFYFMQKYLDNYAYRIDLEWWVFASAGIIAVSIAFLTVGFQSVKAAMVNPVESLRNE